ncbi:transposase, partial [Streptomyces sp. NPDC006367]|uniref:transposase n=1 Tax=Streptomyces sp. NPDC006367 TaxID=3156759 RepID=UPI0033B3BC85
MLSSSTGARFGIDVEVVNCNPEKGGFRAVKRRWVIERSIGWIMMHRRLARDYETLTASSEPMIHIASIDIPSSLRCQPCNLPCRRHLSMLRDVAATLVADLTVLFDSAAVLGVVLAPVPTFEGGDPADTGVLGIRVGTASEACGALGTVQFARQALGLVDAWRHVVDTNL